MPESEGVEDLIGPEPPGVVEGLTREERDEEFLRLLGTRLHGARRGQRRWRCTSPAMYRKRAADPRVRQAMGQMLSAFVSTTWWPRPSGVR
jgi:hypothetical protein